MNDDKMKWLSVRVPSAIKQRLKTESVRTGKTITKVLISAIEGLPPSRIVIDEARRTKAAE